MFALIEADYITGILKLQQRPEANQVWETENLKSTMINKEKKQQYTHAF